MTKCFAIGDLFVPAEAMAEGLAPLADLGIEVDVAEFSVGDFDALQKINLRIEQHGPESFSLNDKLKAKMVDADIIVVHFCPIDAELIQSHNHLSVIGTCRTGTSNIDCEAARQAGVKVLNCKGRLANAVADFTVGLMICEARNIARGHYALKNNQWRRRYSNLGRIPDLPERTVGLVGFGAIAQATAKRLAGFEMRVIAYDPYISTEIAKAAGVELVTLEELMRESDFVSIHVDLRKETIDLIGAAQIALMKPTAYLINAARAGIVNEEALISALEENRIAGAAIDVFENEPPPGDHPFLTLDNVTITPHMAGGSDDAFRRSPKILCSQLLQWCKQNPLTSNG